MRKRVARLRLAQKTSTAIYVLQAATAVATFVLALVVVGFLPDAVVRPRLAERTADISASVHFVGFTGGILSLGVVGFIAGPLAVALLVEAVLLFTAGTGRQSTFGETASAPREE